MPVGRACVLSCSRGRAPCPLAVLKWVRAQEPPCPWNAQSCHRAAIRGRLDVLKWLREQEPPCPWNRLECLNSPELTAAMTQHPPPRPESMEWFHAQKRLP